MSRKEEQKLKKKRSSNEWSQSNKKQMNGAKVNETQIKGDKMMRAKTNEVKLNGREKDRAPNYQTSKRRRRNKRVL